MADLALIISQTSAGLDNVAAQAGCTILAGTRQNFDSLSTFHDNTLGNIGSITATGSGWLALATFDA